MIEELNRISSLYNEDMDYIEALYKVSLSFGLNENEAIDKMKQFLGGLK